jgi:NAD(P)-dependent dehydrogenase (short-subunit alcohol dehydrogenase family)
VRPDPAIVGGCSKPMAALVTGAGSGIGKALALALAERGDILCLAGRREAALQAVAAEANSRAARVLCCPTDLTVDDEIKRLAQFIRREVGRLDVLIHSAGSIEPAEMEHVTTSAFDRQYRINLRAPYFLTQALLPMLQESCGQVVFINSSAAHVARANVGPYAATKHGLKAVADNLREEVNRAGIRVLSVYAGRTATPMQAGLHERAGQPYHAERLLQPADVAAIVISALALSRTAEVTDISVRPTIGPLPS